MKLEALGSYIFIYTGFGFGRRACIFCARVVGPAVTRDSALDWERDRIEGYQKTHGGKARLQQSSGPCPRRLPVSARKVN